jgi:SAM-dependent methyltransferase
MNRDEKLALAGSGPAWTYEFDLGDGVSTPLVAAELRSIHATREQMIMPLIDRRFPEGLAGMQCLDVGCNEGYFSHLLYRRGATVTGVDVRETNIRRALAVRDALEMDAARMHFDCGNFFDLAPADQIYDIVLFLGVLYHIEDPMRAIRLLRSLSATVCVIETQLTRQRDALYSGWGQESVTLELPASFAVFEEDNQDVDRLAAYHSLSFVPNAAAVMLMLRAAGFRHVEIAVAAPGMNPQYLRQDRAVFLAWTAEADGQGRPY